MIRRTSNRFAMTVTNATPRKSCEGSPKPSDDSGSSATAQLVEWHPEKVPVTEETLAALPRALRNAIQINFRSSGKRPTELAARCLLNDAMCSGNMTRYKKALQA